MQASILQGVQEKLRSEVEFRSWWIEVSVSHINGCQHPKSSHLGFRGLQEVSCGRCFKRVLLLVGRAISPVTYFPGPALLQVAAL